MKEGIDLDEIRRHYGVDAWARYADALQPFVNEGLLVLGDGRMWLTRRGMLLANEVMAVFV
jgi:oxygen-independent coproporphyrinogen III oxidase